MPSRTELDGLIVNAIKEGDYRRERFAPTLLAAARCLEWISSRHLDFTARQMGEGVDCEYEVALRWLRTVELIDWVKLTRKGAGSDPSLFRSRLRMRRVG